jgi:predicted TIM-barrel fold metal-dependent hydrolase
MIVDSHAHLKHGDASRTEYTAARIVDMMDAAGIEKAVVFAMSTTAEEAIAMAKAAVAEFPDRLIPYAYALPSYEKPVLDVLEKAISQGSFRGIKVHGGECTLAGYVSDPVFRLAGQLGVPCLVDCKGAVSSVRRLAETFPETTIIVAHLGEYLCTRPAVIDSFIELAEANENIVLDVSGVVLLWKIEEAVHRIGSERVVFGTDGPQETPDTRAFARSELDKIRRLDLAEEQKRDILGGTISRLLHL